MWSLRVGWIRGARRGVRAVAKVGAVGVWMCSPPMPSFREEARNGA